MRFVQAEKVVVIAVTGVFSLSEQQHGVERGAAFTADSNVYAGTDIKPSWYTTCSVVYIQAAYLGSLTTVSSKLSRLLAFGAVVLWTNLLLT